MRRILAVLGAGCATAQPPAVAPSRVALISNAEPTPSAQPMPSPQPAVPTLQPVAAAGLLPKSEIRLVIRKNLEDILGCYDHQIAKRVDVSARVNVTFKILPAGTVAAAKASGINHELETCVVDVFRTFRFPASTSATEVSYPLLIDLAGN